MASGDTVSSHAHDPLQPSDTHVSSYYAATVREHVETSPPAALPRQCDVCVVGGGYTGLSTALHLARRGIDVVLLEQSRIGWGASGRNGGQIHVGLRRDQSWLEAQVGLEMARRLWALALNAREHLDWLVREYAIDCDLRTGLLHVDHRPRYSVETRRHVDKMRRDYGYRDLRYLARDEVRRYVASEDYHSGTLDERGGHLHALNYALGIARAAVSHGARLHEGVTVSAVKRVATGFDIETLVGRVRANRVVLAANGYLRGISPSVHQHVMPINNYIAVTEPLGKHAEMLVAGGRAVSDSRFVVNYFRITPDQRLLFGGGENYGYRFPRDIAGFVRPHLLKVFPQLADVRLDYAWGGTLAITRNRMPWVRAIEPGWINASGFSGLGVVMAPFTGKIIADALSGDRENFDLLGKVPVPAFPGGAWLRFPTLVAAMFFYALRDRL